MKTDRIDSIDIVRGIAMVLMALDHTRDFFGDHTIDALDEANATAPLFLSRWITHLCAPTFVFLAGSSVFLQRDKTDPAALSYFLITRGLFLILFEQTFLRCGGWYFNFDYSYMNANVLWGVGGAMILLALVIRLPRKAILFLGLLVITSNGFLLQFISVPEQQTSYSLWVMFFKGGNIDYSPRHHFYVSYPFVPWFGILAVGYGLGTYFKEDQQATFKWYRAGILILIVFILVRALLPAGNPALWKVQDSTARTFLSFINLEKYPPSFLFTMLTLSCTFFLISVSEKLPQFLRAFLRVLGKVPLFFYTSHIILIHGLAIVVAWVRYGHAGWLYNGPGIFWDVTLPGHPADYGLSLAWVYAITIVVVVALWPVCAWYANVKHRSGSKWLRYF